MREGLVDRTTGPVPEVGRQQVHMISALKGFFKCLDSLVYTCHLFMLEALANFHLLL